MTDTHGVAIICEHARGGHTVAYVDADISYHVPAGWFIEWWDLCNVVYAGRLSGGYVLRGYGSTAKRTWMDWADAAAWCYKQATRKRRAA